MLNRPGSVWGAVAIVLTAWVGVAARGADNSPEKVIKTAEDAAKSAGEVPKTPEEVLSARGLTRSGAHYILKKQEQECFQKFEEVRPRYKQLETNSNQLAEIAMKEAQVAELQAEQAMTQQQLQSIGNTGRTSSRYGGKYARYAQNPNAMLQQQLRAQQTALTQQLAMAKQAVPAKQKQEATALFERSRDALLASSSEIRELFEKVQKEYADIDAEPPVHTALGALRKLAKAQLKIAPSAEFDKKLAQLKKLERMMRPEGASQAPSAKGKGKSKGKRSAKSRS